MTPSLEGCQKPSMSFILRLKENSVFEPANHISFSSTDNLFCAVPTQCLDAAGQMTPAIMVATVMWSDESSGHLLYQVAVQISDEEWDEQMLITKETESLLKPP